MAILATHKLTGQTLVAVARKLISAQLRVNLSGGGGVVDNTELARSSEWIVLKR